MSMDRSAILQRLLADRTKLMSYFWAIVRDYHLAEDIYQDVLIQASEQPERFNDLQHLQAWSRTAGKHLALKHIRSQKNQPMTLDSDVIDRLDSTWSQLDNLRGEAVSEALAGCLSELTERSRYLIKRRFSDNRTGAEIAAELGRERASIYQAMSRTYRTLYECIQRRLGDVR